MRFIFSALLFFFSFQNASAQVVLEQVSADEGQYIVGFIAPDKLVTFAGKTPVQRKQIMSELQQQISGFAHKLQQDMSATDLRVVSELWIRQALAIQLSPKYLAQLSELPYVYEVTPDRKYRATPQADLNTGENVADEILRLDIKTLWEEGYRGQGVVVAIMDTGVYMHDVLKDRYRGGSNSWFDPFKEYDTPKDTLKGQSTHGTGVASLTLGGKILFPDGSSCASCDYLGVAPEATWIAARILNNDLTTDSIIIKGLQWVINPDGDISTDDYPDIVQNSWGLTGFEGQCYNPFSSELAAIDALGIDIVFSIGNAGPDTSSYLPPSQDPRVISVGSVDVNDVVVSGSSRGPGNNKITGQDCYINERILPDLVAPGESNQFASANSNGTEREGGTSFAAPLVSGALALLRSKYKATDHWDYRQALFDSATALPDPNIVPAAISPNNDYGHGLVQASAAAALLKTESEKTNPSVTLQPQEFNFSMAKYSFAEDTSDSVDITVYRSGDISKSAEVTVFSTNSTAVAGSDFESVDTLLEFFPFESRKTVTVKIKNDTETESEEKFNLILLGSNIGSKDSVSITITDDETAAEEDVIGGASLGLLELLFLLTLSAGRLVTRWV